MQPEKCFAYFLSYWYNHGCAKLRTVRALPALIAPITLPSGKIAPSHSRVPLPDSASAPIPTLCTKDATLMLGIYFSPTSGGGTHICKMAKKRLHMGRPDQIKSTPTGLCMEEFYLPTTTRNDVGHCYHRHVTPQAPETVSTGVLQMSLPT
jgi:hypothetical protein